MKNDHFDVVIIGAGPAGCAAALYARRFGIRALILEKEVFPRDKVCGDAISGKSIRILDELGILPEVSELPGVQVKGITFTSPEGTEVEIPFKENTKQPPGFVIRRRDFDNQLFEQVRKSGTACIENVRVTDVIKQEDRVTGVRAIHRETGESIAIGSRIVLACDGYGSVIARKMNLYQHDPAHWIVSLRAYYKNVKGVSDHLEVHYARTIQPGYFWIFPAGNNLANVGIGILEKTRKSVGIDLKTRFRELTEASVFSDRFREAELVGRPKGWMLPVASNHLRNYGAGLLLLGDAAGLIDPFSGEGIGNAMTSAKHAVTIAAKALNENRFDEAYLSGYDRALWNDIGPEVDISSRLQKVGRKQFLVNFIIRKAAKNSRVRDLIKDMMNNDISKKELTNPLFYMKLLFE